jgi:hypothetical protein
MKDEGATACPKSWMERRDILNNTIRGFRTERILFMAYLIESKCNFNDFEKHHRKRFPIYM